MTTCLAVEAATTEPSTTVATADLVLLRHLVTLGDDLADDLVARDARKVDGVDGVQREEVGVADAVGVDLE